MTIYISPNPGKTSANEIALRAAQILMNHGAAVLMCEQPRTSCSTAGVVYLPLEECLEQADVILTIGDGTILHEANLSLRYAKPILGINLGRCGFLATCEVSEMEAKLSAVARGEFSVDNRMLLYVRVLGHDGWEGHALNDVVVTKGRLQQAIDFSIYCDDILVEHYRGDGVIVATPTGSTAYSLAAGGPILDAAADVLVLTPVCAHNVHAAPLVFAADRHLKIIADAENRDGSFACADSSAQCDLLPGESLLVTGCGQRLRLIAFDDAEQFHAIENKLMRR